MVTNRKFSLRLPFPESIFAKYKYVIEPRGDNTAFTVYTYLKYPGFTRKRIQAVIDVEKKHAREEGENIKNILEESKA